MTYKTVAGDSFELVAFKLLGSEKYAVEIMNANPDHIETFLFDAGVELTIPEVETPKQAVLPWK